MIRSYPERRGDFVLEPLLGMTFDSLGEAYDFYNLYSWEHGFGVRYGKSRLNPQRTKTMQEIVCGCSVSKPNHSQYMLCKKKEHFRGALNFYVVHVGIFL
jgi:hypothetical protein